MQTMILEKIISRTCHAMLVSRNKNLLLLAWEDSFLFHETQPWSYKCTEMHLNVQHIELNPAWFCWSNESPKNLYYQRLIPKHLSNSSYMWMFWIASCN
jgi:hypothetical protein